MPRRILLGLAVALVGHAAMAAPADPFTGVWELDSTARPAGVVSQKLTISVAGDEETYRSELLTTKGRRQVTDYVARYDGREYPSTTRLAGGGEAEETRDGGVILHRTDDLTRERFWKQDGRVFRVLRRTVVAGGCEMTSQLIDVAADGTQKRGAVLRFHRRAPECPGV